VFVSVDDPARLDDARARITELVRSRHGREDFSIQNTAKFLSMQKQTAGFLTMLAAGLGGIALLVGGTGILALMLMTVKERTREIGLRMALGANQPDVVRMITSDGARVTLAGVGLGLIGAAALSLLLSSVIFGAGQANPLLLGGLGLALTAVTVAACYLPARRAARVDPMVALRCE
jgi:ABC-type antimicrobial peptide transport system permease subunit